MIFNFFQNLLDWWRIGSVLGARRSSQWPKVRLEHLKHNPTCAVCNSDSVEVHHIKPFHNNPELELESSNLITLCDGILTKKHHLDFGHLGNFKSWNETVEEDAMHWKQKIANRP